MPLPPLSRNVRLALAVIWLVLLIAIEWAVVFGEVGSTSSLRMRIAIRILGFGLFGLYVLLVTRLGFEEEIAQSKDLISKLNFFTMIGYGVVFSVILISVPLLLVLSFFTAIPGVVTFVILGAATFYGVWKWLRLQSRIN